MKSAATQAGFYGVTKEGCADPIQKGTGFEVYRTIAGTENRIYGNDINKRRKLKEAVENQGFDQVIEETAYTWFNRLIAIRFMEVNGYLPTRTRVLSSETGSNTPDLVAQYLDVDLGMSDEEIEKVAGSIKDNRYDDAFALLFVKQCNALNELLPRLFETTDDYMELLLKLSYTSDGVVRMLVDTIPESSFNVEEEGQVEIIGWLYQYYNTEPKDETFNLLKKNVKISKEKIPSATQLFTPDWVVRYMVENSLGRLWVDGHKESLLKDSWKYYIEEEIQSDSVKEELDRMRASISCLSPEDIKVIDPAMGSGHILVYAFDILFSIYEEQGFSTRDIPQMIIENNLYGLDIDKRASQLAYFALMMKGCQYNRRFLRRGVQPHLLEIVESNDINKGHLKYFGSHMIDTQKSDCILLIRQLLDVFHDAKKYGSLLKIPSFDWDKLSEFVDDLDTIGQITLDFYGIEHTQKKLRNMIEIAELLNVKYHAVCTNPPYMGIRNMDIEISDFLKEEYPDTKFDLSTAFMEKTVGMCAENGYMSMINIPVWMFLSSYEKLRHSLINCQTITNMLHFGRGVFGSDFGTTAFVIQKQHIRGYLGVFYKLFEKQGAVDSLEVKEQWFFEGKGRYVADHSCFENIPGEPIAYWVKNKELFSKGTPMEVVANPRQGLKTLDNERFLRNWYEVSFEKIGFDFCDTESAGASSFKWFPINHGGEYHRYYGNNCMLVNWENDGFEMKQLAVEKYNSITRTITNIGSYFKEGITWTVISSASTSFRRYANGFLFSNSGQSIVPDNSDLLDYLTGFLNTKIVQYILAVLSPTLGFESGYLKKIPIRVDQEKRSYIESLAREAISIAKADWDSFETSWDFETHPFLKQDANNLIEAYESWKLECSMRFDRMKEIDEELNSLFIAIYGLESELSPDIEDDSITIYRADKVNDVKTFLSFAVGCMFGRYSISENGLIYAGGRNKSGLASSYIDDDNCIPVTDEEYFTDDIVGKLCELLVKLYGTDMLQMNLDFIANSLGGKGKSSKEVIRNYYLNDFVKDHCSMYSFGSSGRKPIYWMFDSGKQNGFKCLIYMHRYDKDTVGRVRSDYLRKTQDAIEGALKNAEYTIANSTSAVDKAAATKKREKYIKQLNETRTYFQALSHVALQRIEINLDDGVKTNYAKFQGIEIVDENGKKQKIDLLAKI